MKFKTNLKIKSNIIDPVPLVNIMVLFIVCFVLNSHFIGKAGLVIDLPQIEQSELYRADSVVVSLKGRKIFLMDREVEKDKLQEELAKRNPQLLAIKADKDMPYTRVAEIIAMAQRMGIEQIAIATEGSTR